MCHARHSIKYKMCTAAASTKSLSSLFEQQKCFPKEVSFVEGNENRKRMTIVQQAELHQENRRK